MRDIRLDYESLDALLKRQREENPKLHDLEGIDASFDRFGYIAPVVLNDSDDRLLEGAGRLETLERLRNRGGSPPDGVKADGNDWLVPVVRGPDLDEDDARAYLIAANRLVERGGWDPEKLVALLAELNATGSGIEGTGFSREELDRLLADLARRAPALQVDPDEAPPLATHQSWVLRDEVYKLGDHVITCGDSRDAKVLERIAPGACAKAMWTDPPYGVEYRGVTKPRRAIANDTSQALDPLLDAVFTAVDPLLAQGAALYVAHPAGRRAASFFRAFGDIGWDLRQDLVWLKNSPIMGHSDYHFRHEPVLYGFKPGPGRHGRGSRGWYGGNDATSVFEYPRPRSADQHPTMKPVGLVAAMLRNSTRRWDIVLDPFLGSGTTLIACEQLGRRCIGVELDPAYVQVTIQRWEKLTGRTAELVNGEANDAAS